MAFPRKLLAPGEDIVLEARPNWSILVPRTSLFLLVLAACVFSVVEWTKAPLWFGYVLLGVCALFLLWVLGKVITWRSTSLVLTNMRVVYRTGVVKRLGREIPLGRVQDVTYTQSIVERVVGAGSLTIQSAGIGGEDPFPDIRHPAVVQSLINRLISQGPGGYGAAGQGVPQAPPGTPVAPPGEPPRYAPAYEAPGPQPHYPQSQSPQTGQDPRAGGHQEGGQYQQGAGHYPAVQYPPGAQPAQRQFPPAVPYADTQSPTPPQYTPPQYTPSQYTPPQYTPPPGSELPRPSAYEGTVTPPSPSGSTPSQPVADSSGTSPEDAAGPLSSSEQLRHLDELLQLGVITQAEYDLKRRELLGGR